MSLFVLQYLAAYKASYLWSMRKNIFNPLKANWVSLHQWTTKQVLQKRLWSSRSITHLKTTRRVRGILWQSLWIRSSTSPWTQRWIPPRKQSGGGRERSGQEKNRLYGDHRVIVLILLECCVALFHNDCSVKMIPSDSFASEYRFSCSLYILYKYIFLRLYWHLLQ